MFKKRVVLAFTFQLLLVVSAKVSAGVILVGDGQITNNGIYRNLSTGVVDGSTGSAFVAAPGPDNFSFVGIGAGFNGQGQGTVTVSGAGASLVANNIVAVGTTGTGTLLINNGGSVISQGGQSQFCTPGCNFTEIANAGGSTGTVTVDGIGSSFRTQDILNNNAGFLVGNGGVTGTFGRPGVPTNGFLNVLNGASATTTFTRVGVAPLASGAVQVRGPGSNWTVNPTVGVNASINLGYQGAGTLDVSGGGTVNAQQMAIGTLTGSRGNLSVIGAGSKLSLSGQDLVGVRGARLIIGQAGNGSAQVLDGGQVLIDSGSGRGGINIGLASGAYGTLDIANGSQLLISGTNNTLFVINGRMNMYQNSVVNAAQGSGSGGNVIAGGLTADATGTINVNNSTLNAGALLGIASVGLSNTPGAGRVLLQGSAVVNAKDIVIGQYGLFGGQGTVNGVVTNNGGILQVGASPDALVIHGDFTQTGGQIRFEVDSDGHGGFLNSTLVLDWDKIFRVSGVDFYFDFAGGADEQAFISGGLLNLDTFFKTNSGGRFSEAFDLSSTFSDSRFIVAGYNISGFDPTSGRLIAVAVPEPASWMLIAMGLFTMCLTCIRRRSGYALLPDAEAAENHAQ